MRDPGTRSAAKVPRRPFLPSWMPPYLQFQKRRYGGRESTAGTVASRCTSFLSALFMPCAETSSRSWRWRITAASPATGEFGS